ncbi:MAG: DUF5615 family PIN-like protein [Spirochaetaceae bacterium]|nr:DUF5615 family PIN-like protein [Spirochaetaceae bacterium]
MRAFGSARDGAPSTSTLIRILLDENLDWRLGRLFDNEYEVRSVGGIGWSGMRNGELLAAAERQFDVLVTMDRSIEHQQHLPRYDLAVVLVVSVSNRLKDTAQLVPAIESVLSSRIEPGLLYRVADGATGP